jgi:hypothetical protein
VPCLCKHLTSAGGWAPILYLRYHLLSEDGLSLLVWVESFASPFCVV